MKILPLQLTDINFSEALLIALFGFVLVITVLAVLALFVKLLSAITGAFTGKKKAAVLPAQENAAPVLSNSPRSDLVTLDGVSEKDAAVIMAITANRLNVPLERLSFKSIKRLNQNPELSGISEKDAAVVMAIMAEKLKKPIENLEFKSIKLSEE